MINIDMFEVQLGAAVLLRFELDDGNTVTILADAGTHGGGYGDNHVKDKLRKALGVGHDAPVHINLLIGTHYDEDHLNRMNAIITDENITIDEAWMPPVADETEDATRDQAFSDESLLAVKFARDFESGNVYRRYIAAKRDDCQQLQDMEVTVEANLSEWNAERLDEARTAEPVQQQRDEGEGMEFFHRLIAESAEILGIEEHSHVELESSDLDEDNIADVALLGEADVWVARQVEALVTDEGFVPLWNDLGAELTRSRTKETKQRLAWLKKSTASRAVNAEALNDVVVSLKKRGVPVYSRQIQDGEPRRFVWNKRRRQFVEVGKRANGEVEFSLLGPSQSLVAKHWKRLPIARMFSLASATDIPIVGISPSNQLSYVMHFKSEGQGILISGDTGCVDFKPKGRTESYYKKLLKALNPLHVVQISHHGGANAHFYRVLLKSGGRKQLSSSLLLLSHETKSKSRPSNTLRTFVGKIRTLKDGPTLVLTSVPKPENISDYADLIHDVVGAASDEGDASIKYDGTSWTVIKHAIDKAPLLPVKK